MTVQDHRRFQEIEEDGKPPVFKKLGATVAVVVMVVVLWNSDPWEARDRYEVFKAALFGRYVPKACRENPSVCKSEKGSKQ